MKTKQLIVGMVLGLGLLIILGFQNQKNESSGEIAMVEVWQTGPFQTLIVYYYPDGTSESEIHNNKDYSDPDHPLEYRRYAMIRALNTMARQGYTLTSTGVDGVTSMLSTNTYFTFEKQ